MVKFEVMWRTRAPDDEFSIFSLNIHTVRVNFIIGMWTGTFQAERLGGIVKLLQQREIIFLDNVLVAVAVALVLA